MRGTLFSEIHQQLNTHPTDICLVWNANDGTTDNIDCRTLLQHIEAYCNELQIRGIKKDQSILIAAAPSPQIISAITAIMGMGCTAVLPPAKANAATVFRIIRKLAIRHILLQQRPGIFFRLLAGVFQLRFILLSDVSATHSKSKHLINSNNNICDGEGGLITYSSGSTGTSKAIHRTCNILYAQHIALKKVFPPWQGQIDFPLFPNIILHNMACGVKSVMSYIPGFDITKMKPEKILAQIEQETIETLTGNVFYFKQLLNYLQQYPSAFTKVQAIGIGGSPVPEYLIPALQPYFSAAVFYIIYGSSEAEPIAIRKYNDAVFTPADGYCVGEVDTNLQIKLNVIGNVLLSNDKHQQVGEIAVKGNHVAAPAGEWLLTGDFGYLDGNQLWLTGRKGNEKIHDEVQHYQIEHCLVQMLSIENAAARADDGFTLFIQGTADETSIKQTLYMRFKKIKINGIIFRNQLPLDRRHHSKIRYELLN